MHGTIKSTMEISDKKRVIVRERLDKFENLTTLVESLLGKISSLMERYETTEQKLSIIAVTETWAKTDNDIFPIPGYTSILKAREKKEVVE